MPQESELRISQTMKNLSTMEVQITITIKITRSKKSAPLLRAVLTSNLRGEPRADWEKTKAVRGSSSSLATANSNSFSIKKTKTITKMWLLYRTVKIFKSSTSSNSSNSSLKKRSMHLSMTINKWTTKIITAILTIKTQNSKKISWAPQITTPYNNVTKFPW
jgi:hypothetical protein